jgi:hypothetical protein
MRSAIIAYGCVARVRAAHTHDCRGARSPSNFESDLALALGPELATNYDGNWQTDPCCVIVEISRSASCSSSFKLISLDTTTLARFESSSIWDSVSSRSAR